MSCLPPALSSYFFDLRAQGTCERPIPMPFPLHTGPGAGYARRTTEHHLTCLSAQLAVTSQGLVLKLRNASLGQWERVPGWTHKVCHEHGVLRDHVLGEHVQSLHMSQFWP